MPTFFVILRGLFEVYKRLVQKSWIYNICTRKDLFIYLFIFREMYQKR